ncbi:MAG: transposase [Deltaproteobacteria bacterium]|nr:transposase [Deltaproteobacteria bacterium]
MVNYRRNRVPGGTFFFTLTLAGRRSHLLVDRIDLLRDALRVIRRQHPLRIKAMVVLPEHLHTIWTLPPDDDDFPRRWQAIKSHFTSAVIQQGVPLTHNTKGEYRLWQRRYWEHTIRDENDLQRHVDYIYYNPVKHGLVKRVVDWPFSSFHRYVRLGWLSADWGGAEIADLEGEFGE